MKIDANVELTDMKAKEYGQTYVKVPVDIDYVEADVDAINEWVANELEEMFGGSFCPDVDFVITNINDILEDMEFDEFENKIN